MDSSAQIAFGICKEAIVSNRFSSIGAAMLACVLWAGVACALDVVVTSSANDTSSGSLRWVIADVNSNGGGRITFDPALAGQTILLTTVDDYWFGPNGLPAISSAITIDGGQGGIVIARSSTGSPPNFRLFYVSGSGAAPDVDRSFAVAKATATVTLSGLNQTYDATAKAATVTANPSGLAVSIAYDGAAAGPTNAGSYAVEGRSFLHLKRDPTSVLTHTV